MSKSTLLYKMLLPFRLPQMIADKVTPKTDILSSDESLERRIRWGGIGSTVFGCLSMIGLIGVIGMAGVSVLESVALAVTIPTAIALTGACFVTETMANICRKSYIDSLAVKCVNAAVVYMAAEAEKGTTAVVSAPKAPEFNHAAATTLDKDIQAMPTIKLAANRGVSP